MMKNLWTLYKKELAGAKSNLFLVAAIILVWEVFLATRQGKWQPGLVFGLSFLPCAFLPVWAIISGIQSLRREWSENSTYVLLSLPTPGWTIVGAKTLAIFTELTFYMLIVPGLVALLLKSPMQAVLPAPQDRTGMSMLMQLMAYSAAFYWLLLAVAAVVGQFCYLVSTLFDRFQWAAAGWVFLLSAYILTRGAHIISPLFEWVPDLPVRAYAGINGVVFTTRAAMDSSPIVATTILGVAMFVTVSFLVERSVEV